MHIRKKRTVGCGIASLNRRPIALSILGWQHRKRTLGMADGKGALWLRASQYVLTPTLDLG
jgi:hypothetical protein